MPDTDTPNNTTDELDTLENPENETTGAVETYVPNRPITGTATLEKTGDTLEEINRVLWELAKAVFIITAMLLGVSFVIIAYYAIAFIAGI